jgi:hypothetical protein
MPFEQRYRPGLAAEAHARELVRKLYPKAQSSYSEDGAIVFDELTGKILGRGDLGDWAVEFAWQDAANSIASN